MVNLPDEVRRILNADPAVRGVQLVGSRATGRALPRSDWDFRVETGAFADIRERLPERLTSLCPVAAQWDRLSSRWCYMLILPGPVKVDLLFGEPHVPEPPWQPTAGTLPGIDCHLWDWVLWLAAKQAAGKDGLVAAELARLHEHLLAPLGVGAVPVTLTQAVAAYRAARTGWENRLGRVVPRAAERAVAPALP